MLVEIDAPHHFITVRRQRKLFGKPRTMKPDLFPGMVHEGFEIACLLLPKTPGAIVLCFRISVDQEDFLTGCKTSIDHAGQQAERCTASTNKYVLKFFCQASRRKCLTDMQERCLGLQLGIKLPVALHFFPIFFCYVEHSE